MWIGDQKEIMETFLKAYSPKKFFPKTIPVFFFYSFPRADSPSNYQVKAVSERPTALKYYNHYSDHLDYFQKQINLTSTLN